MALPAPLISIDDEPATCKAGHPMVGANILMEKGGKDRVVRPRCRTCKKDAHARWLRRTRTADLINPRSMVFPRKTRAGNDVVVSEYKTDRLFALVPKDFQRRLAGALMDQRVDPLQRRVLQRCADRRAWAAMHEDAAVRVFIEAVIEQTIDARSSLLRIDRLLGLILG